MLIDFCACLIPFFFAEKKLSWLDGLTVRSVLRRDAAERT